MVDLQISKNNSETLCKLKYQYFTPPKGEIWCSAAWDSILCWPPILSSTTSQQRCPPDNGVDTSKFAERRCSVNGSWEGRGKFGEQDSPNGWTNYTPCFTPEMLMLIRKLYAGTKDAAKLRLEIAEATRTLEFVGLSISLVALVISLTIFCRFRSLRNTRTRIHKNLFVAMVIQVLIRLTLYIDQALLKSSVYGPKQGINNTPILCKASYVLLEYARTAMFMWMFVEGFFLHNMVTVSVFHQASYYRIYRLISWGLPIVMTSGWALVTALNYHPSKCWWGYNLSVYFWILEGPRMAIILLNFLFLLNIVRVLVVKLRQSHSSEIEQAGKAVRAAVVLLPLLGITNLVSMTSAPLDNTFWFGMWSYTTHFMTSFQGLFISTLYCFLNGEVRLAVKKSISVYLSLRTAEPNNQRRSTLGASQPPQLISVIEMEPPSGRFNSWAGLC